jgi:hypothetical protein
MRILSRQSKAIVDQQILSELLFPIDIFMFAQFPHLFLTAAD